MHILILGRDGQVGSALASLDWPGARVTALDRAEADLTDQGIAGRIASLQPQVVINAAAYTNVEGAERESELAFRVNAQGPALLAQACAAAGAWLIHYSTDYVFDGTKVGAYLESDTPNPLNVYGASKWAGEQAVVASGCAHLILRTGWVYSRTGNNFVQKILARARAGLPLSVVNDQFGAPTWADALARATRHAVSMIAPGTGPAAGKSGLYHLSAAGSCSWFELAQAALALHGLSVPVTPIASSGLATATRRPRNSVLDSARFDAAFGYRIAAWQDDLRRCYGVAAP